MIVDRYEFRIHGSRIEYLNPQTGEFQVILTGKSRDEVLDTFLRYWRDVKFHTREIDGLTVCDYSSGSFAAFS